MARMNLTSRGIIAAAADIADRDGFDGVTVSSIARDLGVQPASLYGHVKDRAAVLDGIHELALDELADRIAAAVAGRAGRDALIGLAEAHRSYAADFPGRWHALQLPATPEVAGSPAAARVASLTLAMLRGYPLQGNDLVHATRMLAATINGYITLERAGSFGHRSPGSDESWQHTLNALDAVLRQWSTRPDDEHDRGTEHHRGTEQGRNGAGE
ncbi:TetR-like C-terminal domain-containing protein [Microlunatus soli]|uniref:DNA-binding transcriptional regulator, AcrR family n=1 Tax=Microlunatus soli TaxID=630515 RepID=A0A1H1XB61_9ACTN|nr:TetR-like C-terminal domain-containing protein [Microlunatus soli]SDT06515.1 DNA-binding transcriptional regulator, AcrR family [Microlunatus soli]